MTWKKVKNVDGYEIYRADGKNKKYKKIATVTKGLKVNFTVQKGKTAGYYKVRAYKNVGGTKWYGAFSARVKS